HLLLARLRMELNAPRARADPEALRLTGKLGETRGMGRRLELVGVCEKRVEPLGEDAEHRVGLPRVGECDLVEAGVPLRRASHGAAGRVCERLPAEAHAEQTLD